MGTITAGAQVTECTRCGFQFTRPQTRTTCQSETACTRRMLARLAGDAEAEVAARRAPAVRTPAVPAPLVGFAIPGPAEEVCTHCKIGIVRRGGTWVHQFIDAVACGGHPSNVATPQLPTRAELAGRSAA